MTFRQQITDLQQKITGLSYPALDQLGKLANRQSCATIVDALTPVDSFTFNTKVLAPREAAIVPANFSAAVSGTTCSTTSTSASTIDGEKIGLYVDRGLSLIAETACDAAPDVAGEGTNTIPCVAFGVTKAIEVVLDSLIDHQEFCNGLLDGANADATLADIINVHDDVASLDTHLTNVNNGITSEFTSTNTHITNVDNHIATEFTALDTHVTNVDNHVATEFVALDAHLVALINQLTTQIGEGTALLNSDLRQVMKLQLTPDGQKSILPAILTCTGTNCPNVLAACPAAGCSWNRVGPLP